MQTVSFTENHLRILIVDDNEINCDLLVYHLREMASSDIANSGEAAIAKARQNRYDLILLDISLGIGMNGVEVLNEMKVHGSNKNTPVIAVTGSVTESDQKEFLTAGFNGFLSKPFSKQELMDAIKSVIA
ncbi:MAG: response regulator [Bacteroidetes bacterium]|nr:response regulator [Bacteroidota bacterium]